MSQLIYLYIYQAWAIDFTGAEKPLEGLSVSDFPKKNLIVTFTTDKGLCGGVNSILCRLTRQLFTKLKAEDKDYEIFVLGEKGRGQLRRAYADKIISAATDRTIPYTFDLACAIAQDAVERECDAIHLVYNEFVSAIAYTPSVKVSLPSFTNSARVTNSIFFRPFARF